MRSTLFRRLRRLLKNKWSPISVDSYSPSRRQFLKTSLSLAAAISTLPLIQPVANGNAYFRTKDPVVIIGAGLAGLTTAYALMRRGVDCVIYEASERLGGRVFTQYGFNKNQQFCELGGELVDSNHAPLIGLCEQLGLSLQRLDVEDGDLESEYYFINGRFYKEDQVADAYTPLEEKITADIKTIQSELAPLGANTPNYLSPTYQAIDQLTVAQYLETIEDELEPWFKAILEAAYVSEFGLALEEQSALNLVLMLGDLPSDSGFKLYGESDELFRIQGGNSQLVKALLEKIYSSVPIHYGHCLEKITDNGTKFVLQFSQSYGVTLAKRASRVVLALPFTTLRQVEGVSDLELTPKKLSAIQTLGYGTNSKLMMNFNSRFWRDKKQVNRPNAGEIYTDLPSQNFWETSRLQKGQMGILTHFCGGVVGKAMGGSAVEEALKDLKAIYGKRAIEDNLASGHKQMNWFKNQFSQGSYSCLTLGQYAPFYGQLSQPEIGQRLIFAGEQVANDFPSYMCGAVESGLKAAQQVVA